MTYDEIIAEVAESVGLSKKLVDKAYRAYWKKVREYVTSMPFKEDLTDEEFLKLRPNVNIPSLGKLNVTLDRYQRVKISYKKKMQKKLNKDNHVTHKED